MVKVKPYELLPMDGDKESRNDAKDNVENEEKNIKEDAEEDEIVEENEKIGSKSTNKIDINSDVTRAKYLKMEPSVCFLENAIFVVEVPSSEHNKPKGKEPI